MISIGRVPAGRADRDRLADTQPELAQHRGAERDLAGRWPAGGRPSTVEDIIGPVPGARPIAGITVLPMVTVPCTPNVTSVMPGTCAVIWLNCFGVTASNCPSYAMSQAWPYRLGVPTRRSRFAPNVPAPATAATATARPSRALRTGTLARPVPGSSANRTPVTAASGAPAHDSRSASRGRRRDGSATSAAGRAPACRHAVTATRAASSTTIAAAPAASTPAFTLMPGSGSASRAGPIGVSGDTAMAIATAPRAPATVAAAVSAMLAANSWRRVMPRAASVPLSWVAVSRVRAADLADDEQRGERQREREQREGHRLRADRALDGSRLRRLVGDEDLLAGRRVALRELLRGRGEGSDGGARLQLQVRAVERHVAGAELAEQREAAP